MPSGRLRDVDVSEMSAADSAAEEHGGCSLAQVRQEVLKLGCVVPAAHTQVEPEVVESVGVCHQLGVADLAEEGGRVVAVDEPVRILPGVEAGVRWATSFRASSLMPPSP